MGRNEDKVDRAKQKQENEVKTKQIEDNGGRNSPLFRLFCLHLISCPRFILQLMFTFRTLSGSCSGRGGAHADV